MKLHSQSSSDSVLGLPVTDQNDPRAHKNKIGTPPPPKTQNTPPPKTRNFMDMGLSCRKNAFFQASIKLTHPFPAPELRTKILRTRGFFWTEPVCAKPYLGRLFSIRELRHLFLLPKWSMMIVFWRSVKWIRLSFAWETLGKLRKWVSNLLSKEEGQGLQAVQRSIEFLERFLVDPRPARWFIPSICRELV